MRLNKQGCLAKRKLKKMYMKGGAKKKGINCLLCQGRVATGLNFSKENAD